MVRASRRPRSFASSFIEGAGERNERRYEKDASVTTRLNEHDTRPENKTRD